MINYDYSQDTMIDETPEELKKKQQQPQTVNNLYAEDERIGDVPEEFQAQPTQQYQEVGEPTTTAPPAQLQEVGDEPTQAQAPMEEPQQEEKGLIDYLKESFDPGMYSRMFDGNAAERVRERLERDKQARRSKDYVDPTSQKTQLLINKEVKKMMDEDPTLTPEQADKFVRNEMKGDAVEFAADILLSVLSGGAYTALKGTKYGGKVAQTLSKTRKGGALATGGALAVENMIAGAAGNVAAERDIGEGLETDAALGLLIGGPLGALTKPTAREISREADTIYKNRQTLDKATEQAAEAERLSGIRDTLKTYEEGAEAFKRDPEAEIFGSRREKEIYGEELDTAVKGAEAKKEVDLNILKSERDASEATYRRNADNEIAELELSRAKEIKGGGSVEEINAFYDAKVARVEQRLQTEIAGARRAYDDLTSTFTEGLKESDFSKQFTDAELDKRFGYRGMSQERFDAMGKPFYEYDEAIKPSLRREARVEDAVVRKQKMEDMLKDAETNYGESVKILKRESNIRIGELNRQRTSDVADNKRIDKLVQAERNKLKDEIKTLDTDYKARVDYVKQNFKERMPQVEAESRVKGEARVMEEAVPYRRQSVGRAMEDVDPANRARIMEADIEELRRIVGNDNAAVNRLSRFVDDVGTYGEDVGQYANRQYINPDEIGEFAGSEARTRLDRTISDLERRSKDVLGSDIAQQQVKLDTMGESLIGRLATDASDLGTKRISDTILKAGENVFSLGMAGDIRKFALESVSKKRAKSSSEFVEKNITELSNKLRGSVASEAERNTLDTALEGFQNVNKALKEGIDVNPNDVAKAMDYVGNDKQAMSMLREIVNTSPAPEKKLEWNVRRVMGEAMKSAVGVASRLGGTGVAAVLSDYTSLLLTGGTPVVREILASSKKGVLIKANELSKLRSNVADSIKQMDKLNRVDIQKRVDVVDKARGKIEDIDVAMLKDEQFRRLRDIDQLRRDPNTPNVNPELPGEYTRLKKNYEPLMKERARLEQVMEKANKEIDDTVIGLEKAKTDKTEAKRILEDKLKSMDQKDAYKYLLKQATRNPSLFINNLEEE